MNIMPKLCINCEHCKKSIYKHYYKCSAPHATNTCIDLIKGNHNKTYDFCSTQRTNYTTRNLCGIEGKYYKERVSVWKRITNWYLLSLWFFCSTN